MAKDTVKNVTTLQQKLLSSYEKGVLGMQKESKADSLTKDGIVQASLRRILGLEVPATLDDGTVINASAIDLIAMGAVIDAIQKPSMSKLKDAATIMGEGKVGDANVEISITDKYLREMSVDDD